jgi:hypothetical protein
MKSDNVNRYGYVYYTFSFRMLSRHFWSVVSLIDTKIICCAVNSYPVGFVNTTFIFCCRAVREGTSHPDPPVSLFSNLLHLIYRLCQILILTKNNAQIIEVFPCHPDDIESKSDIHPFFLTHKECIWRSVRQTYCLIPVPQWS